MTTTIQTDEIVFSTVPSLTTCSSTTITWAYVATTPVTSFWPLVVTDVGIDQEGHSRRGYPLLFRRSAVINVTLAAIHPSMGAFQWPSVSIPQGRYRLDVYASAKVMSSNVFNVTNGSDTSCLAGSFQSSIQPSSGTSISTPSSTGNPSAIPPTTVPGGSMHKGLIAGTAVSGVAILFLIAAVALWVFRRRNATSPGSAPGTKGQLSKALHHQMDSIGATLPFVGRNQENFPQSSASEDDSHSEKTAVIYDQTKPSAPSIAAAKTYSRSSLSSRRPVSMAVKPSFESRETIQSNMSRQTHRSLDSSAVRPNNTAFPYSSPSSPHPRYPTDRTRRASRKPVPVYDPNEFPGAESNGIPLSGRSEMGLLDRKQTFYLIPDPPLEQRK